MKRFITNYLALFFILLVCTFVFKIQFSDFVEIKYVFPNRVIYIMISILINFIYLKISFQCIEQYLEINVFSLIRIGRKEFNKILLKRSCAYITVFSVLSIFIDYLLYQRYSIYGLTLTILVELIISVFIIFTHTKIHSNILLISLIFCLLIKAILNKCSL